MFNDLYRDDNNKDNPTELEELFSKYESEIADLFRKQFYDKNDIVLTKAEYDSLLLFLALLPLRSKHSLKSFGEHAPEETKKMYLGNNENEELIDFWRKNLSLLVKCRSILEVLDNKEINESLKLFMLRDTIGYAVSKELVSYLIVVERRGVEDFFISDAYGVSSSVGDDKQAIFNVATYYPISPKRMIIRCSNLLNTLNQETRVLDPRLIVMPKTSRDGKKLTIHVNKMYEDNVAYVNDEIYLCTKEGCAFFDKNRFFAATRNK